jgi:hypothetical protein
VVGQEESGRLRCWASGRVPRTARALGSTSALRAIGRRLLWHVCDVRTRRGRGRTEIAGADISPLLTLPVVPTRQPRCPAGAGHRLLERCVDSGR